MDTPVFSMYSSYEDTLKNKIHNIVSWPNHEQYFKNRINDLVVTIRYDIPDMHL